MSSVKSNLTDAGAGATGPGRSTSSVAVAVLMIALLGALVWGLSPSKPGFRPAPFVPYAPGCPKASHDFIPTNITEISDPPVESLAAEQKNQVIARLNMEPCTCGCAMSLAFCRLNSSSCETSRGLANRLVARQKAEFEK
jgi:hypothetical protein